MPIIIQPHATIWLEGEQSAEECADERHEAAKDRNGTCDDIRDDDSAGSTAKPSHPVNRSVLSDVLRATQYAKEHILCW